MELETRISELEQKVAFLLEHDNTHALNSKSLHEAVSAGLPLVVEGQEQAVRALDTNQKALVELVKAIDNRVVLLVETTKRHAQALDRIENVLGIQGKAKPTN